MRHTSSGWILRERAAISAALILLALTDQVDAITIGPGDTQSGIVLTGTDHLDMTGGSILDSGGPALRMLNFSTANISGGLLRSTNAFAWSTILLENNSEFTFTGGQVEAVGTTDFALSVEDRAKAHISGGSFSSQSGAFGTVRYNGIDTSEFSISGGTFTASGVAAGVLDLRGNNSVTIANAQLHATGTSGRGIESQLADFELINVTIDSGGEGIFASTSANFIFRSGSINAPDDEAMRVMNNSLKIYGGNFASGTVDLQMQDSTAEIYVQHALLNGAPVGFGPLAAVSGTLDLTYRDGSFEQLTFSRTGGALVLIQVPEPNSATAALFVLVILHALNGRSRKSNTTTCDASDTSRLQRSRDR